MEKRLPPSSSGNSAKTSIMCWTLVFLCLHLAGADAAVHSIRRGSRDAGEGGPQSICIPCHCHGLTVICDYAHNKSLSPILDSRYSVPANINGMELTLTDRTEFELHGGLFQQNRVNRFVVKGPNIPNGNDQVELIDNAFRGNLAGYPDLQILGVSSVFVRNYSLSGGEIKLRVENSDLLVLFTNAFINMNMSCNFTNIRSLVINEKSFNPILKSYVNLHIENAHIEHINRFDVSMNKIVFINCTIGSVQSQAFDVTNINQLAFENCRIGKIEERALTSKLFSEHVSITGTQIGTIDSKAIMGSGISKLTLKENTIDTIKEDAILVHSVFVYFERNWIKYLGDNWIHVNNGELIAIEDNHFGNFAAMQLNQDHRKRTNCTFVNNWLGNPQPNSLNFSNCEVRAITVDHECSCDDGKRWLPTLTDHDLSSELYCQLGKRLDRCFNASQVHLRRYVNEVCGVNRTTLRCIGGHTMKWYRDNFYTEQEREQQMKGISNDMVILIVFGVMLACGAIVLVACYLCGKCKCARSRDTCILSDTDRNILEKDHERLSMRSDDSVAKKLIKKLISNRLTPEQCSDAVMQLTQHLKKLSDASNRVLANHMATAHSKKDDDNYTLANHHQQHHHHHHHHHQHSPLPTAPTHESNDQEPIYAEPLLSAQYSLPSDPMDAAATSFYSEPYNSEANASDMPQDQEALPQYAQLQRQPTAQERAVRSVSNVSNASYATPVWRQTADATPILLTTTFSAQPPTQRHARDMRPDLEMSQLHPINHQSSSTSGSPARFPSNHNTMRSFQYLDGAASLAAMEDMAALPPDSGSNHSGGSDETVKIDEIEYVDA
ncbi:uncharacterized protein be [Drosophila virilis]|uniref:Right handed beta helix domain-containing protein n=1 Tax=Drosophila virilis TaxID=7244 RepID=B4M8E4_DROVI|nr:uncharacterized protein LOC6633748 [Drosophila virilis]EDW62420.1 uncharacterized protein Dvir_GJ16617 [Drosophila virilis]